MCAPDEAKTKRTRISDRIPSTHQLSIVEEITLCFGGRPIIAFAYMFGLVLMSGALTLSEWIHGHELSPGTKRTLAKCCFALALNVSAVAFLSCRKKTRRWLFEQDHLLVGRTVSARAKWCARLLPVVLLAAVAYLWGGWSR
jgi:hypothetical protein